MPAIRRNNPPLTPPPQNTLIGPKHNQPSRFRATGQGYFNQLPYFPANQKIANGCLTNHAVASNHPFYKIWLFVDAAQTGWKLTGETTQTQASRSFYPRNMQQDDLVIAGSVANQFEYDRLVCFTDVHHLSQFNPNWATVESLDGTALYPGVEFKLFRPQVGQTTNQAPPMHYNLVITSMDAGHERFKNFPTWQMTCKVTHDHLQQDTTVEQAMRYWTTVKDVFGDVKSPKTPLTTGSDTPQGSQGSPAPQPPVGGKQFPGQVDQG